MEVPKPSVNSHRDSFNISPSVQQPWRIVARNVIVRIIMPRIEKCAGVRSDCAASAAQSRGSDVQRVSSAPATKLLTR
jgi:hypothetical protein